MIARKGTSGRYQSPVTFAFRQRVRRKCTHRMSREGSDPVAGDRRLLSDTASAYRRLLGVLAFRARRLGSRDPESAAQEVLRRALENRRSEASVHYYFGSSSASAPEWPLDQLLAWLHGILKYVVREEQSRASSRHEVPISRIKSNGRNENAWMDPADPGPHTLEAMIDKEMRDIVDECLASLEREYRTVLRMRGDGLKYSEIAEQLGVNENTVATWLSRAIRKLAECTRRRTRHAVRVSRGNEQ